MAILRIRENFHPHFHQYDSILDFEEKWKAILITHLDDERELGIICTKLDSETNCVIVKKDGSDIHLETSYFIGLDYLRDDLPIIVEPKFDDKNQEYSLDFYKMLFESLPYINVNEDISNLYHVDFEKPAIAIEQKDDFLTPVLIIQYLNYLTKITHLGLQKGYYWINENLSGKVKGKILIKETINRNHLKADFAKTYCRYQEFGINTKQNQHLKTAFQFCLNYLNSFQQLNLLNGFENKLGFIKSSFEKVDLSIDAKSSFSIRKNPLFPSYEKALTLANLILKRTGFNITNTTSKRVSTYPYWINMSKLFELHVLKLLRKNFPDGINYQKVYSKRIPDIIINQKDYKAVVDVKYKAYNDKSVEIEDIRQVAAYARMKTIFNDLGLSTEAVLDSIIIYPEVNCSTKDLSLKDIEGKIELEYYNIFKLKVDIPVITNPIP